MSAPKSISELQRVLSEDGIPPQYYSFVHDPNGSGCFYLVEFSDELGRGWRYSFAERGQHRDVLTFRDESEACEWFYDHVEGSTPQSHRLTTRSSEQRLAGEPFP